VRFSGVPVQTVAPSLGENALVGAGRITGRFDLTGSNVRTADDLSGTLVAAFQGTSPTDLPLFGKVIPYLTPLGLTRPFDTGDVRANLSRGVLRVQRLALVSPNAQVFAGGTVTTGGRVDLAVTAHTGQIGPGVAALRIFGLRLPAIGPVPLGLIAEVSSFLSNRTLRLEVAGTTDAPVVRVNTRALLTDEAVRFFLGRYVLPAETADVFGTGAGGLLMGGGR
jgi:translocation and assembly module TamB